MGILFLLYSFHHRPPSTNADGLTRKLDVIYQFGDSISDTGNFIRMNITSMSACSSLPYGKTYFGLPTGRCSDGLLMVDFIAKQLDLPFVKPYLDANADFSNGVNFAIYSASALSAAALEAKDLEVLIANDSLLVEMGWFKTHLQSLCSFPSQLHITRLCDMAVCPARLSRSLFIMGEIGGNDINFSFFEGKSFEFVYNLIPDIVLAVKNAIQEVINMRARYILVPGNFPIGCIPIYRGIFASNNTSDYDHLKCLKAFNQVAKFQNEQLQKAVTELQEKNQNVQIAYVDLYSAYTWLIDSKKMKFLIHVVVLRLIIVEPTELLFAQILKLV
ncbi:hypothetical protein V2J09_013731 [Rumex salicifolius]